MKKLAGLVFIFCALNAACQPAASALPAALAHDSLVRIYQAGLGPNLPLYNGRQFYGYPSIIKEHAFFPGNVWSIGSVLYDNIWYSKVSLRYDVYKDEVVIMHPNGVPFTLVSDRVQEFSFDGLIFVRFDNKKSKIITTGFYQQLSNGKVTLFAKRIKLLEEKIIGLELERKFIVKDQFYILKDSLYTTIKKKKSLLGILKDKHSEVQQYIKQAKMRYKDGPEFYITQVTAFYNKLY